MTKINQKEYGLLKSFDDKWRWIARDGGGVLWIYEDRPEIFKDTQTWDDLKDSCMYLENDLFQFIQWEDEEPYNIAELIEEYEDKEFYDYVGWEHHKREKSEVKGIEWLKREIHKELETWHGVEGGIDGDGINEIMLLINQFEESKVKQLERKIKELDSYNDELIRDNNQFRNELDNQEVLSEEWIERNTSPVDDEGRLYVWKRDLQNAIVPKQDEREQLEVAYKDILERREFWFDDKEYVVVEKPVIPQFVADFISDKEDWTVSELFDDEWLYREHDQIAKWLYDNDDVVNRQREADLVFAKENGYEVETEQKYYVVNNDNRMMLVRMMDGKTITEADPFKLEDMYEGEKESHRLTEKEIKDYDERYWAFRKPVEELE